MISFVLNMDLCGSYEEKPKTDRLGDCHDTGQEHVWVTQTS